MTHPASTIVRLADSGDSGLGFLFALLGVVIFIGIAIVAVTIVVVIAVVRAKDPTRNSGNAEGHTLTFTVGQTEQHVVTFRFDQIYGWITITVDNELVLKHLVTVSVQLVTPFDFQIGTTELHHVHIEKRRPLWFSFARPQPITAWVDGVQVARNPG